MNNVLYYSYDRDENGVVTVFHLKKGDLRLYDDDADIFFGSMSSLGIEIRIKEK